MFTRFARSKELAAEGPSVESVSSLEREATPSLFLIGARFDGSKIPPGEEESGLSLVTAFAFDLRDGNEIPLLRGLPLRQTEDLPTADNLLAQIQQGINVVEEQPYLPVAIMTHREGDVLEKNFAQAFGVDRENLRVTRVADLSPHLRHELGYHLLTLADNRRKIMPEKLRQALRNTGNTLLMSVGVDRWIDPSEKTALIEAYNKRCAQELGELQFKGRKRRLKPHPDIEALNAYLELPTKAKGSFKTIEHPATLEREGFFYTVSQLAKRGVRVQIITHSPRASERQVQIPIDSCIFSIN